MTLRYPATARLLKAKDFLALRSTSKRIARKLFHCEYRPTQHTTARLGMAVSRKVSKQAVTRNRIRRQIRESFRLQRARLPCCDILVIARVACATQDNKALRTELEALWTEFSRLDIRIADDQTAIVVVSAAHPEA